MIIFALYVAFGLFFTTAAIASDPEIMQQTEEFRATTGKTQFALAYLITSLLWPVVLLVALVSILNEAITR